MSAVGVILQQSPTADCSLGVDFQYNFSVFSHTLPSTNVVAVAAFCFLVS